MSGLWGGNWWRNNWWGNWWWGGKKVVQPLPITPIDGFFQVDAIIIGDVSAPVITGAAQPVLPYDILGDISAPTLAGVLTVDEVIVGVED